jgi:DNA-binding response OmpR family regulator
MKNKKLLIIDDDPSIRFILQSILKNDYETEIKENAYEALVYMQEGNIPDAIISDITMPKLSGQDFLEIVKSSYYFKNIPFIFLSGKEDSQERVECLKKGADDYLLKPFNPEELLIRIFKLFKPLSHVQ